MGVCDLSQNKGSADTSSNIATLRDVSLLQLSLIFKLGLKAWI